MADVFISYSPPDHARVREIAERLSSLGYVVIWNNEPRTGRPQYDEIERRIDAAAAVLTVWTQHARNAPEVFAQSARALDAGKLLQMRLDNVAPPAPFKALPLADMSGDRREWGPLEDSLQRLANGGPAPDPLTPVRAPIALATPALLGAPKLLTIATALLLLGYAGAVWAAYAGLMSPDRLQLTLIGLLALSGAGALLSALRLFVVRRAGG